MKPTFVVSMVMLLAACAGTPKNTAHVSSAAVPAPVASFSCTYPGAADELGYPQLEVDVMANGSLAVADGSSGDYLGSGAAASAAAVPGEDTAYKISGHGEDDNGQLDGSYLLVSPGILAGDASGKVILRDNATDTSNRFTYTCKTARN